MRGRKKDQARGGMDSNISLPFNSVITTKKGWEKGLGGEGGKTVSLKVIRG